MLSKEKAMDGVRLFVFDLNGTPLLEENWKQMGIDLVQDDPDAAVQSFDTTMT